MMTNSGMTNYNRWFVLCPGLLLNMRTGFTIVLSDLVQFRYGYFSNTSQSSCSIAQCSRAGPLRCRLLGFLAL